MKKINNHGSFFNIVNKPKEEILALTQSPDYDTNTEKQKKVNQIQKEIDQLVYQLYNLTEDEIKLIA